MVLGSNEYRGAVMSIVGQWWVHVWGSDHSGKPEQDAIYEDK